MTETATNGATSRRWTARSGAVVALTAAALLLAPGVASARPHNPTNGEISAADGTELIAHAMRARPKYLR